MHDKSNHMQVPRAGRGLPLTWSELSFNMAGCSEPGVHYVGFMVHLIKRQKAYVQEAAGRTISSKKMMQGAAARAVANSSRTARSLSPSHCSRRTFTLNIAIQRYIVPSLLGMRTVSHESTPRPLSLHACPKFKS